MADQEQKTVEVQIREFVDQVYETLRELKKRLPEGTITVNKVLQVLSEKMNERTNCQAEAQEVENPFDPFLVKLKAIVMEYITVSEDSKEVTLDVGRTALAVNCLKRVTYSLMFPQVRTITKITVAKE